MTNIDSGNGSAPTARVAEKVLADALGARVRLDGGQAPGGGSGRANVLRCAVLDGPGSGPASVIVKHVNVEAGETYEPDAKEGPAVRLFTEWTCLQFLGELEGAAGLAPRFYGGDRSAGVIVMEDLGQGDSLVQPLLGSSRAEAESALDAYFRSLGRLNAVTHGHAAHYWRIRDGLGPREPESQPEGEERQRWFQKTFDEVCERAGVAPAAGAADDVARAARMDVDAGPFLAFSQSDTCPDNCIRRGDGVCFFDFEWGWFRSALSDGSRARANFPSCWCVNRLPDDVIRRCEDVYRAELVRGCPEASDDAQFHTALVTACAHWTLRSFEFYRALWTTDNQWGTSTERQRAVARFELLAQAAETFGCLEALGATARELAVRLQSLWPEVEPMPYYPALR